MVAIRKTRGVESRHEQDAHRFFRDTRTFSKKFSDFASTSNGLSLFMGAAGVSMLLFPALLEPISLVASGIAAIFLGNAMKETLPMRLPTVSGLRDYNDPKPGRTGHQMARGTFHIGNRMDTNEELYLANEDMLRHMLVLGTTGSGKTEFLVSLAWAGAISSGSGLIYVDPKAAPKLGLQIYTLARMVGREDDFLMINYTTGGESKRDAEGRISNTANPLAYGSADSLTNVLVSLIPSSEGENAIFSESAISLISAMMMCLVELRDGKKLELSVQVIRDYMNLESCIGLYKRSELSELARSAMLAFLKSKGYNEALDVSKQDEKARTQFSYAAAYFNRALSSLTDTYGHIYGATMGEVDFFDVVMNNRILLVLLPAMEKPPAELKNLGKIILSAVRGAMAIGLGSRIEGTAEDVLDSLPTASNIPSLVIADEYAYVATEGFAVTAAQARGLGFSVTFAGQDYAGIKRGSEAEAEQIVANTNTKIFMKMEDCQQTWEMAKSLAGEADVMQTSGYGIQDNTVLREYGDKREASITKRARIDLMDLRSQVEGECHVFFNDNLVRAQTFHADPPVKGRKSSRLKVNTFLEIERADPKRLASRYGYIRQFRLKLQLQIQESIKNKVVAERSNTTPPPTIAKMREVLDSPSITCMGGFEALIGALMHALDTESAEFGSPAPRRAETAEAAPVATNEGERANSPAARPPKQATKAENSSPTAEIETTGVHTPAIPVEPARPEPTMEDMASTSTIRFGAAASLLKQIGPSVTLEDDGEDEEYEFDEDLEDEDDPAGCSKLAEFVAPVSTKESKQEGADEALLRDLATADRMLGLSDDNAQVGSEHVINTIAKSIEYPEQPTPKVSLEIADDLRYSISHLLKNSEKRMLD